MMPIAKMTRSSIACVSLIIAGLMFVGIGYAEIIPETCVGLWLFDREGDVARDSSGNGNDGQLVNEPRWGIGKRSSALEFDGADDYVDCGNDDSLNPQDSITIVAWFKAKDLPSTYPRIVSKETDTTANPYNIMVRQSDSVVRFLLGDGLTEYGAGDVAIALDTWYHVAATYDGSTMKVYLDGTLSGTRDLAFTLPPRTTSVLVGNNPPNNRQFSGTIDEVAVFSVALSQEDIEQIRDEGILIATGAVVEPWGLLSTTWGEMKKR